MTDAYWNELAREFDVAQVRMLFEQRVREFTPIQLSMPEAVAMALLERLAADGFLLREEREIEGEEGSETATELVYVRKLAADRVVDWVVALHGMNTSGAWQESFSWLLGTTWGRAVPVAVYKYGIVIAGVFLFWRRNKLRRQLRRKLEVLATEARARGYNGNPDVIALMRASYAAVAATGDAVVPLARFCIARSGPSGRRGFAGDDVINVAAEGYGHSDLFLRDLRRVYETVWKPFLTLPREELHCGGEKADTGAGFSLLPS